MLGPQEKRAINIQIQFSDIKQIEDATRPSYIEFHAKTDGKRIWGVITNHSKTAVALTPKSDLCNVMTTSTSIMIPDQGIRIIEDREKVSMCRSAALDGERWKEEFPELFEETLGKCQHYVVNHIPLKCPLDPRQQPKPPPRGPAQEQALQKDLDQLIKDGIVSEAAQEPLLMPIFGVPKKEGGDRIVADLRRLNSFVRKEPYSKTSRTNVVASIQPFSVGSSLDISRAYNQIVLGQQIRQFFGFSHRNKQYVFNRLPFGYSNSPFEFQRALDKTLRNVKIQSQLIVYADDILVLSCSDEQHEKDLQLLLKALVKDGWKLNPKKSKFGRTSFQYLGMELSTEGWTPESAVLTQWKDMKPPQGIKEWRKVKGWWNEICRFVWKGATVSQALKRCEESGKSEDWTEFLKLLEQHTVRITLPSSTKEYSVSVDASSTGWGACLQQDQAIIVCTSGLWNSQMQKHRSNELEAEALLQALQRFKPYIYGQDVTVYTDNSSTFSLDNPDNCSPFVYRRLVKLLEFCPDIRFVDGRSNVIPDFLSRMPHLRTMQEDPYRLLKRAHDGHFCARKTMQRLKALGGGATWKAVKAYVESCTACQRFKAAKPVIPLGVVEEVMDVKDVWSADFIGPLKPAEGGVQYILAVTDHLSRFLWTSASKRADTKTAQRHLQRLFDEVGVPKVLLTDSASYFTSEKFQSWLRNAGIRGVLAPGHAHHSNGQIERCNQNLIGRLRRMMHEGARRPTWMKLLKKATDVINETANDVTGSPPAVLWAMGRLETEVISEVRQARSRARQKTCARQQKTSEGRSSPSRLLFQAGESVWLRDHVRMGRLDEKFAPFWKGPYPVNRVISNHLRELQCGSRSLIVHVDSLREVQHREACGNE